VQQKHNEVSKQIDWVKIYFEKKLENVKTTLKKETPKPIFVKP